MYRGKRGAAPTPATEQDAQASQDKRKQETLALAQDDIRQQLALEALRFADGDDAELAAVDDTDDLDIEAERAAWRLRELGRVKRERDELIKAEQEREELELLRESKTEAERDQDAADKAKAERIAKHEAAASADGEGNRNFLQKYYHKGAFYQDQAVLKNRDFQGAIEDDYKDKSVLPKALQMRGFEVGLKGRTKYRTLAEEDTSRGVDSPWFKRGGDRRKDEQSNK